MKPFDLKSYKVCQQILNKGCVESFTELFYLKSSTFICDNDEIMSTLVEVLQKAEIDYNIENYESYLQNCETLVQTLQDSLKGTPQQSNHVLAYFLQKLDRAAQKVGDQNAEMRANYKLGTVMIDIDNVRSIEYFERYMQLARTLDISVEKKRAAQMLCTSYSKYATQKQKEGDYPTSIQFFLKALESARANKDRKIEYRMCKCLCDVYRCDNQVSDSLPTDPLDIAIFTYLKHILDRK
jgi:hypothetical protein